MSDVKSCDLVVIGGGPAGYAAAIRAGQLGRTATCVEMERVGGTCLNWGCIPTKALLKSAELYQMIRKAEPLGLSVKEAGYDYEKIIQRSRDVAARMAKGIEFLLRKNKVDLVAGRARVNGPGRVDVTDGPAKGASIEARNILIATGCRPKRIPGLEVDGVRVMTSREALALRTQPKSIVIIGAGAIGVEFACFFNAFGTKVTLVEMLPRILPAEDHEVSALLERSLAKQSIAIHTGTRCGNIRAGADSVSLDLVKDGNTVAAGADAVLLAVGVSPCLGDTLSPAVPLELDRGFIKVDDEYRTSVPGIYAAGDIIGPPWLAHVATFEAVQAVNGMFGHARPRRVTRFPACTYCQPQVASAGLTERAAQEKGIACKVGKFPFMASGKAVASATPEGFVKVVSAADTGRIIGVHIIGPEATELIGECGLAMELDATIDDMHNTIHAHPTLSEALAEAAAATTGNALHI